MGLAVVLAVGVVLEVRDGPSLFPPAIEPGIDLKVERCVWESQTLARATIDVTVTQSYSFVAFTGNAINTNGVVGTGTGSLHDVHPGLSYTTEVVYSLRSPGEDGLTCEVQVESAS